MSFVPSLTLPVFMQLTIAASMQAGILYHPSVSFILYEGPLSILGVVDPFGAFEFSWMTNMHCLVITLDDE